MGNNNKILSLSLSLALTEKSRAELPQRLLRIILIKVVLQDEKVDRGDGGWGW